MGKKNILISLFQNNDNKDLDMHYEKMLKKEKEIKDKNEKDKERYLNAKIWKYTKRRLYIVFIFGQIRKVYYSLKIVNLQ